MEVAEIVEANASESETVADASEVAGDGVGVEGQRAVGLAREDEPVGVELQPADGGVLLHPLPLRVQHGERLGVDRDASGRVGLGVLHDGPACDRCDRALDRERA